jgi:hypothetical protein
MCEGASSDDRWRATVFALFNDIQMARQNRIGGSADGLDDNRSNRLAGAPRVIHLYIRP